MTEKKKITYLIGAGASANALPVVNGMNDRLKLFYNILFAFNENEKHVEAQEFKLLYELIENCTTHQTIDTYAKKLWYKNDTKNYNLLKRFLVSYLLFEQTKNNLNDIVKNILSNTNSIDENVSFFKLPVKFYIKDEKVIKDYVIKRQDERYDSFFASLLNKDKLLDSNINIVSWNYDLQFELSYSDFYQNPEELDEIQNKLQIFPRSEAVNDIDVNKSSIIKINGTGSFRDLSDKSINIFDVINESFSEKRFLQVLFMILFNYNEGKNVNNQLKFAWENKGQVMKARKYAQEIIGQSEVIVIIGYSFPTFNRDVDRQIFSDFDSILKGPVKRKIYIQDTKENAPKIKQRLRAVLENYDRIEQDIEIHDDIDQFLIPYEL